MFFKRVLIFIFCLRCSFCEGRQVKTDTVRDYSVTQLQQDYTIFRQLLEKAHPSLHRYTPQDSITRYFDKGYRELDHPMNDVKFWELLQGITSRINSGHTCIAFNAPLKKVFNFSGRSVLPFYVYIRENRLFVKGYVHRADTAYKIGNQILQINGVDAGILINQFRALISGDGFSNAYKDYKLETYDFLMLYNMVYGDQDAFSIVFKTQRGIETKSINAWKGVIIAAKLTDAAEVPPHLIYPPGIDSTAVLRIGTFVYKDYRAIHKSLFKEINKNNISNLIIDLRGNPGGYTNIAADLLKYLVKDAYYFLGHKEYAIDTLSFIPVVNNINSKTKYDLSSVVHDPTFLNNIYAYESNSNTFNGNVYILTDGGTFSAATLCAVALKTQRKCLVIGQETGGGETGTDGLKIMNITLPNTGLILRLPFFWAYSASTKQNEGHGLMPDIKLKIGAKQIYEQRYFGKDPAFEFIKQKMIQNRDRQSAALPQ